MTDSPRPDDDPSTGFGWMVVWLLSVVAPGFICPLGSRIWETVDPMTVGGLIGVLCLVGMAVASERVSGGKGKGCVMMIVGLLLSVVTFFVGCASQLKGL